MEIDEGRWVMGWGRTRKLKKSAISKTRKIAVSFMASGEAIGRYNARIGKQNQLRRSLAVMELV